MRWWKVLGLAGVVGVAATGAMTVRSERQRRAYTPEEIRSTLHERVAALRPSGPRIVNGLAVDRKSPPTVAATLLSHGD